MNREEILNKSRLENKNGDERELQVNAKAGNIAFRFGVLMCMLMVVIERLLCSTSTISSPLFAVYCFMTAVSELYVGITLKSKKGLYLGIVFGILCVLFLVFFILDCVGK